MKKGIIIFLFVTNLCKAQGFDPQALNHLDDFFNDVIYYTDKFISPAADAVVYQSSSGWMHSAKKPQKNWNASIGIHTNFFFIPNRNKSFLLQNEDLSFLRIQDGNSHNIPTALGNGTQINIEDKYNIINPNFPIETPKGIDQDIVFYPHFSGSLSIVGGAEILLKFAPKKNTNTGFYQVYGFGIQYNISQHIKLLESNKFNLSIVMSKSVEKIAFDLQNNEASFALLAFNRINGDVNSWQFQTHVSKEYENFEIILGSLVNISDFKYYFSGDKQIGEDVLKIEGLRPQEFFNQRLKSIYKTKINCIFETSVSYKWNRVIFQSSIAINRFVNTNFSIHYKIN